MDSAFALSRTTAGVDGVSLVYADESDMSASCLIIKEYVKELGICTTVKGYNLLIDCIYLAYLYPAATNSLLFQILASRYKMTTRMVANSIMQAIESASSDVRSLALRDFIVLCVEHLNSCKNSNEEGVAEHADFTRNL